MKGLVSRLAVAAAVLAVLVVGAAVQAQDAVTTTTTVAATHTDVKHSGWLGLPPHFLTDLAVTFGFGVLVILLVVLGYLAFDAALRRVDFNAELNKNNTSVGLVVAATILGICYAVTKVAVAIIGG